MFKLIAIILCIYAATSLCHSSCDTCFALGPQSCVTCSDNLTAQTGSCNGISGFTNVIQKIDSIWAGETPLTGIRTYKGIYTPSNKLIYSTSPPLTVYQSGFGSTFLAFAFVGLPSNHYKIQLRTHATLQGGTGCSWFQFEIDWGASAITKNISDAQFIDITEFNDETDPYSVLQIKYTANSTQVCSSMKINDITIIAFLCPNCIACSGYDICTACGKINGTSYYLDGSSKCVTTCTQSYFEGPSQFTCDSCDSSCSYCYGTTTNCTVCNKPNGYVTSGQNTSICVLKCEDGYYKDDGTSSCQPCDQNCLTCDTSSSCTSCGNASGTTLYLFSSACMTPCLDGYYGNSYTNTCDNCDTSCITCFGGTNAQCNSCLNLTIDGVLKIYYLSIPKTTCSETCLQGQYVDISIPNICQNCSGGCLSCKDTATTCTECSSGSYLLNGSCVASCVLGTYENNASKLCSACHIVCAACFDSYTTTCYNCTNNSGIVYYLQVGTTNCVSTCPNGQFPSKPTNLCNSCSSNCTTCNVLATNCTSCLIINGTKVYLYNSTCVTACPSATYMYSPSANKNVCGACFRGCLTCVGSSSVSCTSCLNLSTVIYFKDPSLSVCSISCPAQYFGDVASNQCQQCQSGCKTCTVNSSYCQSCEAILGSNYYLYQNSCISACPNGTKKNDTDLTCSQQQQISTPFSIETKVILPSRNFQHRVLFPYGLSSSCTVSKLSNGLKVEIYVNNRRLLATSTPLTVISVSLVSNNQVIIITNSQTINVQNANIAITFPTGSLLSSSGASYSSVNNTLSLNNPVFLSSYYKAYGSSISQQTEGISFTSISTVLLILSMFLQKRDRTVEMVNYVQTIQIIGLTRVRQMKYFILQTYNVLNGFAYTQLLSIPNIFTTNSDLTQTTSDAALLTYGSQNIISNFGSIFLLIICLQAFLLVLYLIFRQNEARILVVKSLQKLIVEYWFAIIIYGSLLSVGSMSNNKLEKASSMYITSVSLSFFLIICSLIYLAINIKQVIQKEFFLISNLFKIICLAVLAQRWDLAIIFFNLFECLLLLIEAIFLREQKNLFCYFGQRLLVLGAINCSLLAKDSNELILISSVLLGLVGFYKLYILIKAILCPTVPKQVSDENKLQEIIMDQSQNIIKQDKNLINSNSQNTLNFIPYNQNTSKIETINYGQENNGKQSYFVQAQLDPLEGLSINQLASKFQESHERRRHKRIAIKQQRQFTMQPNIDYDNLQIIKFSEKPEKSQEQQKQQKSQKESLKYQQMKESLKYQQLKVNSPTKQVPFAQFQSNMSELQVIDIS